MTDNSDLETREEVVNGENKALLFSKEAEL